MSSDPVFLQKSRDPSRHTDTDTDTNADAGPRNDTHSGQHFAAETGSRIDSWWQRINASVGMQRLWHWGAPGLVLFIAIFSRFFALAHPHSLVFDETFYVKDAWSLWNNGYESSWPNDSDTNWANGITNGYSDRGSFVVHPQLGKWLIALGMVLFGSENSFSWRFSTAIAGVLLVALIMFIAKRLFKSTLLMVVAGGLLAIDGQAIVLSRVGLLDNFVALFSLARFRADHARPRAIPAAPAGLGCCEQKQRKENGLGPVVLEPLVPVARRPRVRARLLD